MKKKFLNKIENKKSVLSLLIIIIIFKKICVHTIPISIE